MKPEELDRVLSEETDIVPSSGFVAAVMEAVTTEATAPPLTFPWKRAWPLVAGFPALRPSRASPDVQRVEGDGLAAAAASAAASLFAVNTTHLSDSTDRIPIDLAVVRVADGSAA